MTEAQYQRHIINRISGLLMIVDGISLVLFGRYKAFDLKFLAWHTQRSLEKKLKAKGV